MAKQIQKLFKSEVYEAMQRELQCPSKYRGVEEALDMISGDSEMNTFFRDYATKEGIYNDSTFSFRARTGKDLALFIAGSLEKKERWLDAQERREGLYLGPRQKADPLLFVYAHNGQITDETMGFSYGSLLRRKGGWVIDIPEYNPDIGNDFRHATFLLSSADLFNLSKEDVLVGLKKMIKNLLRVR